VSNAIEVRGLSKVYGEKRALDGMNLDVPSGSVFGFLGPNGAGKTTTLRILTGLAAPTTGEARVFGRDVTRATNEVRADIGVLPDVPGFYEWMTGPELLRFAGRLFGGGGPALERRVQALVDLAGLSGVTSRIGGYSRGMRQRLGVAQALINAPKLLMLDEPTSALDPIGRKEVLDMIASLGGRTTVFFSTHILSDVERVCDHVAILRGGRVVIQATVGELTSRHGDSRIDIEVTGPPGPLADELRSQPWATEVGCEESGTLSVKVDNLAAARVEIPAAVARLGLGLVRFETGERSLEEVFVDLAGGEE